MNAAVDADRARLLDELVDLGIALAAERDLGALLERIVESARRVTRAEAGTLFLREDDRLRFAVVQNELLEARLGPTETRRRLAAEPLELTEPSLAAHAVLTGEAVNVPDAYALGPAEVPGFNPLVDADTGYGTRSVLVVPVPHPGGGPALGALELINARDEQTGALVAFDASAERLARAIAAQAAVALRSARLDDVSFKDSVTELYNERYFVLRLDEEVKRHTRYGHPLSLVLMTLDGVDPGADRAGRADADETLREVARLLARHSRNFTVLARRQGAEFVAILANTPKAGGLAYAERIRTTLARHAFGGGPVTASFGVAGLPADATTVEALVAAAAHALAEARRLGGNRAAAR